MPRAEWREMVSCNSLVTFCFHEQVCLCVYSEWVMLPHGMIRVSSVRGKPSCHPWPTRDASFLGIVLELLGAYAGICVNTCGVFFFFFMLWCQIRDLFCTAFLHTADWQGLFPVNTKRAFSFFLTGAHDSLAQRHWNLVCFSSVYFRKSGSRTGKRMWSI